MVSIAIRNGAWSIATETSLGVEVWRGLPLEYVHLPLISIMIIATLTLTRQRIPLLSIYDPPHSHLHIPHLSPTHPNGSLP